MEFFSRFAKLVGYRKTNANTQTPAMLAEYFSRLPEDCISEVLSFTSPRDASRSSAISWLFKSAADSDVVWERFLPSDYLEILLRSPSPPVFSTKKQLYFSLCDSPILLDGGRLSFTLDKETGKKCYALPARELSIAWGDTPQHWTWISVPKSRFSEVAKLRSVCWLDIRGKMKTKILSPNTTYAAYLLFHISEQDYGIASVPMKTSVKMLGVGGVEEDENDEDNHTSTVYLKLDRRSDVHRESDARLPRKRKDEWMEIELGEFFHDQGDAAAVVEMRLKEIKIIYGKGGLLVEGIEVRPKVNA